MRLVLGLSEGRLRIDFRWAPGWFQVEVRELCSKFQTPKGPMVGHAGPVSGPDRTRERPDTVNKHA